MDDQRLLEDAFIQRLSEDRGIRGLRGIDVIPPTVNQTAENIIKTFMASDADCLILVTLREGSVTEQEFTVKVFDKISGKNIWVGDTTTKSLISGITENQTLRGTFGSLASNIISKLAAERILQ